eukprot:COSAG02_NODE_26_length_51927_cov_61.213881_11_plen_343_part_00
MVVVQRKTKNEGRSTAERSGGLEGLGMGVRAAAVFTSKQFAVHQDQVGMKVGIDGIVLAAAAARATLEQASSCAGRGDQVMRLLDVGCGCGIIALLLRQAASFAGQQVHVTALDIDAPAAEQARENVARSPWPADIDVQHSSLQDFVAKSGRTAQSFDLVVSNPPYFPRPPRHVELHSVANRATQLKCHGSSTCANDSHMDAADGSLWPQSRAHARFREYLPPHDLLRGAATLLAPHGQFWCVYPASEEIILLHAAQAAGLRQRNRLGLKFKADLPVARVVLSFELSSQSTAKEMATSIGAALTTPLVDEEMAVRHDGRTYTEEFVALTEMCYGKVLPTVVR